MTPLEFIEDYEERTAFERWLEALDLELPLHLYLKVHEAESAYSEAYYFSKWGLANGTHRIIPKPKKDDTTGRKQKEIDFLAALDEIEQEMLQKQEYLSSLRSIERELMMKP